MNDVLELFSIQKIDSIGRIRKIQMIMTVCSFADCGKKFSIKLSEYKNRTKNKNIVFCSKSCFANSREKNRSFESYQKNCENLKCARSCQKNWTKEKRSEMGKKARQTFLAKGDDFILKSIKKQKKTWQNKTKKEIDSKVEKYKNTCNKKYGKPNIMQVDLYCKKSISNRGEPYYLKNEKLFNEYRKKMSIIGKNSFIKAHKTRKKNGSYKTNVSKIESDFYSDLCSFFQEDNIERQILVGGFSIDFYVKNLNTYIEFDGVYWHGLDRPLSEIKKHKTKRDVKIHEKYMRDREKDSYFKSHNMNLFRVTDCEYKKHGMSIIENILKYKHCNN